MPLIYLPLKSGQSGLYDAQCSETYEKQFYNFYFFEKLLIKYKKKSIFSEVFKITWNMRNVLKRMKNLFSLFSDFHFSSYGGFCTQLLKNFLERINSIEKRCKVSRTYVYILMRLWSSVNLWHILKETAILNSAA